MLLSITSYEAAISITCYFMLNLFVTYTNKQILGRSGHGNVQQPYLLTTSHQVATFIGCVIYIWFLRREARRPHTLNSETKRQTRSISLRQHLSLAGFSLLYTVNIALSNLSLALIDLPSNQTIRATAPVLTVIVSVLFLRQPRHAYSISTYLSLLPIILGVIVAVSTPNTISRPVIGIDSVLKYKQESGLGRRTVGILISLLGAFTAVLKTVLTHKLMTSLSLKISALELLQILSPYASIQALSFAYFTGECSTREPQLLSNDPSSLMSNPTLQVTHDTPVLAKGSGGIYTASITLWLVNAIAAFLLNITSFEANKRNGPTSMAVAANLKQVAVLVVPLITASLGATPVEDEKITKVLVGTVLTVVGGIWYAWSIARDKNRRVL